MHSDDKARFVEVDYEGYFFNEKGAPVLLAHPFTMLWFFPLFQFFISVNGSVAQFFFDTKQLVVFCHTV